MSESFLQIAGTQDNAYLLQSGHVDIRPSCLRHLRGVLPDHRQTFSQQMTHQDNKSYTRRKLVGEKNWGEQECDSPSQFVSLCNVWKENASGKSEPLVKALTGGLKQIKT